jgi:protoporphyrinogen oxidase
MNSKRILIVGAGPAGLACANELFVQKNKDFFIDLIEKDSQVGGISKTVEFDGYYYDLGGHRFFSKIKEVNQLWKKTLSKDFISRKRLSRIYYNYKFYDYPLKIKATLFNLGLYESFRIGISYLKSKLFPMKDEQNFEQWVTNRFGSRLYNTFFKTYTEKVWGLPCSEIRAEWAAQRIKNLSLISAVLNALPWKKKNTKVKTLIDKFNYPKYGPGMMYEKMAENILKNKNFNLNINSEVLGLSFKNNKWCAKIKETSRIYNQEYDFLVSTMPISSLIINMDYDIPIEIKDIASKLKYREFLIVCLVFDKPNKLKDTWIYIHDKSIKIGRLQILNNWSPYMVKDKNHASYGAEYFCSEGDDLWKTPDSKMVELAVKELKKINLVPNNYRCIQGKVVRVKKTYPVYDKFYADNISKLISFIKTIPNLQVAGRAGTFKYNNMDHSIYTGILAAKNIILNENRYDIWSVNQDEEYHETDNIKTK